MLGAATLIGMLSRREIRGVISVTEIFFLPHSGEGERLLTHSNIVNLNRKQSNNVRFGRVGLSHHPFCELNLRDL